MVEASINMLHQQAPRQTFNPRRIWPQSQVSLKESRNILTRNIKEGKVHRSRNLPSATKQPPKKLEFVVPPDAPLFPHLRVPKLNTAPPKPVKVALWKIDKPTFGQDYCPKSRAKPDNAHEKNGVAPSAMLPAPQARPPVDMQRTTPILVMDLVSGLTRLRKMSPILLPSRMNGYQESNQ